MFINEEKFYLSVSEIAYPENFDAYFWGPGVRDVYIIHYIRSGSGFYECGGKKYPLHQGQSFLIFPGQLIHYYPNKQDPWTYTWVNFSGLEAKELLDYCALSPENPVALEIHTELDALFNAAAKQYSTATPADICRNSGFFRMIFSKYLEYYPAADNKATDKLLITRAAEYIENNYRRPELNLDEISAYCGINRVTLHRKFISALGLSPGNYITQLRLQKACRLLESSDFSIKSIAYSNGFSEQLYFSKVFKKHLGITPTQYRKNLL